MLDGTRDLISGSRELATHRDTLAGRPDVAQLLGVASGVASETDHLPIGGVRALWALDSLAEKDRESTEYLARRGPWLLAACQQLTGILGPCLRRPDDMVMRIDGPEASDVTPSLGMRRYDPELDDFASVLSDACDALAEDGRTRFVVRFSGEAWPVDVRTDLLAVLEQLPRVAEALPGPFEVDFFGQGIDRALQFEPWGDELEIRCTTHSMDWTAPPTVVTVDAASLRSDLRELMRRFVELATAATPRVARHPWFIAWRSRTSTI